MDIYQSYFEESYNEFKPLYGNPDNRIKISVKTSIQTFYDLKPFDNFKNGNADELLKDYLLSDVNERRNRHGLGEWKT